MVDFTESFFQINKSDCRIMFFLASITDDIGESLWVLIITEDIVPKSLLSVTFDVLIFSCEVVKSISDECFDMKILDITGCSVIGRKLMRSVSERFL